MATSGSSFSNQKLWGAPDPLEAIEQLNDNEDLQDAQRLIQMAAGLNVPIADPSQGCPVGYICNATHMSNCTTIRGIAIAYGYGDVHAGMYCPGSSSFDPDTGTNATSGSPPQAGVYKNCRQGYYCPAPEIMLACPAGYFCPAKTLRPAIPCEYCPIAAQSMYRNRTAVLIVIVIIAAMIVFLLVLFCIRRYQNKLYHRMMKLSSDSLSSVGTIRNYQKIRKRQQDQLRPKLYQILQRVEMRKQQQQQQLQQQQEEEALSSTSPQTTTPTKNVTRVDTDDAVVSEAAAMTTPGNTNKNYSSVGTSNNATTTTPRSAAQIHKDVDALLKPAKLFDTIDENGDGVIQFSELQHVLELNPEQLQEFIRRMNDLAGDGSQSFHDSVSRKVFVKHFFNVLRETNNFGPDPEEVHLLWESISEGKHSIPFEQLYESELAAFLSDEQINQLIRRFRKIQASHVNSSLGGRNSLVAIRFPSTRQHGANAASQRHSVHLTKDTFCENYASLLSDVTQSEKKTLDRIKSIRSSQGFVPDIYGIDLTFQDLSLVVKVGQNEVNVVNHVTGRVAASTMAALIGGSGAGKTSLLNALCGRAFYGRTEGKIIINGQEATLDKISSTTGFVPQDDIVFAELTVKENLIYSGRFRLPKATTMEEIEELAEETMASLGLSRVANSLVGDVRRRGLSGGEKKRVNIGLELMAKPQILFLDEPTSGLDSSSALLVMKSLKNLVLKHGMTVLSVIHQPRKEIFYLFDSLVLLGVGGNLVFHGPVHEAESYFGQLDKPYTLPPGESLADWLIDISSGRLAPNDEADDDAAEGDNGVGEPQERAIDDNMDMNKPSQRTDDEAKGRREYLFNAWKSHFESLGAEKRIKYEPPCVTPLPEPSERASSFLQCIIHMQRNWLLSWRNMSTRLMDTALIVGATGLISYFQGVLELSVDLEEPGVPYEALASASPISLATSLTQLFSFSLSAWGSSLGYGMRCGVILIVILALAGAKNITEKRLEFFREAGSGINVNSYFLALNITSFVEHFVQVVIAGGIAMWLRDPITSWYAYLGNFVMLMWVTISWALLLPLLLSPDSVVIGVAFFMAFFGFLFSGAIPPLTYKTIYNSNAAAVFSAFFSAPRFFIEANAVQEFRCQPSQTGFTAESYAVNFPFDINSTQVEGLNSFQLLWAAQNDKSVVQYSCGGWFWGYLPALMVGLTVRWLAFALIHVSGRPKQSKKSIATELRNGGPICRNHYFWYCCIFFLVFLGLGGVSIWLIIRDVGSFGLLDVDSGCAESSEIASSYLPPTVLQNYTTVLCKAINKGLDVLTNETAKQELQNTTADRNDVLASYLN